MEKLIAKNRQFIVLAHPNMQWLQLELAERKPKWFIPGKVDWNVHPDGTPNIFIHDIDKIKNRHVLFLASTPNGPEGYVAKYMQLAVLYVLTRSQVRTLTVSWPFINTATMERISREGEVATADVDSWLFSSLPRIGSPVEIIVYDLHTLQNRFYFHDGAILTMATATGILKRKLRTMIPNFVICFPDAGASSRFGKEFLEHHQVICKKTRIGDQRLVEISNGLEYVKDAHVLIVDDLVQSGSTLIETRDCLIKNGASNVSAFTTHAIFPNSSYKKMFGKFTHFFITNTCPIAQELINVDCFEVLSITEDLLGHLLADKEV